jgi:hypothetical protein
MVQELIALGLLKLWSIEVRVALQYNTKTRCQTSMPQLVFEPVIPLSEQPKTSLSS